MAIPMLVELALGSISAVEYLPCIGVPAFLGLSAVLATRGPPLNLGLREAYLLTAGLWFLLPLVAALPFIWAAPPLSPPDPYFKTGSVPTPPAGPGLLRLPVLPPALPFCPPFLHLV